MKNHIRHTFLAFLTASACLLAQEHNHLSFEEYRKIGILRNEAQQAVAEQDFKTAAKTYIKLRDIEISRSKKASWLLKAADAYLDADKPNTALELYKDLLANYPLYVPYDHVVVQLRLLAENEVAGKGTFLGLSDVPVAIKVYELIIRETPAVHLSKQDRFRLAELLRQEDRREEAVAVYQAIIKNNARDWDARAELAIVLADLARQSDGDGSKTRAATREAKLVLAYQPEHPKAKQLKLLLGDSQELNAERLYEQAAFYLQPTHKRPRAARRYLHDVINAFPDTSAADKARQLLRDNPDLRQLEDQETSATGQTVQATIVQAAPQDVAPAVVQAEPVPQTEPESHWYDILWPFGSKRAEQPDEQQAPEVVIPDPQPAPPNVQLPAPAPQAEQAEQAEPESHWYDILWPFGKKSAEEPAPAEPPAPQTDSWYSWIMPFNDSNKTVKLPPPKPQQPAAEPAEEPGWLQKLWPFE